MPGEFCICGHLDIEHSTNFAGTATKCAHNDGCEGYHNIFDKTVPEKVNQKVVGVEDYKDGVSYNSFSIQHWDWAAANKLDYFQGQITKYVARWRYKGGIKDLKKAQHFLEKYIGLVESGKI